MVFAFSTIPFSSPFKVSSYMNVLRQSLRFSYSDEGSKLLESLDVKSQTIVFYYLRIARLALGSCALHKIARTILGLASCLLFKMSLRVRSLSANAKSQLSLCSYPQNSHFGLEL